MYFCHSTTFTVWIILHIIFFFPQHAGSELIYTNVLQSVRPYTVVSRKPSLILPLACRIPAVQAKGPQLQLSMPTETEIFGPVRFWIEIHFPGEGPLAKFTKTPEFRINRSSPRRIRREELSIGRLADSDPTGSTFKGELGSKIEKLDLHVMSNCSIERAEMLVSNCIESESPDFRDAQALLDQGSVTPTCC